MNEDKPEVEIAGEVDIQEHFHISTVQKFNKTDTYTKVMQQAIPDKQ